MHVQRARSLVGQAVDHPGVAVEVEDDGLVLREKADPLLIVEAMGMLSGADELEEIHDVDDTNL